MCSPMWRQTGSQLQSAVGATRRDIQRAGWSTSRGTQLARLEGRWVGSLERLLEDVTTQGNPDEQKGAPQMQWREGFQAERTAYAKTLRMEGE